MNTEFEQMMKLKQLESEKNAGN